MAKKTRRRCSVLTERVKSNRPQLRPSLAPQSTPPAKLRTPQRAEDCFQLLIDCGDEASQRELYEWLHAAGWQCRVLVM